jgi:UDP-2-acetamido-3-amino-2,3-dideoxy-glucuronate N-acetyltransferase
MRVRGAQPKLRPDAEAVFIYPTACVDDLGAPGPRTLVLHFCHVMCSARLGSHCRLAQNVFVAAGVVIGSNVKIQNNFSVYAGCHRKDDIFCHPSCVFTNVVNQRSDIRRRDEYRPTVVCRDATFGANARIICGRTLGRYAFVGAGAVVSRDVPDCAVVVGVPARRIGWMGRHGYRHAGPDADGIRYCPVTRRRYQEPELGVICCLDCPEDGPPQSPSLEDERSVAELVAQRDSGRGIGG